MAQEWQDDSDHAEPQWSYAERIYIGAEQNFSAEFYDGLSQVAITSIALKELDRRTAGRRETPSRPERRPDDLKRFCRHGGPDLCHIRNYLGGRIEDKRREVEAAEARMEERQRALRAGFERAEEEEPEQQTVMWTASYDRNFERHLSDHNIWVRMGRSHHLPPFREPLNIGHIKEQVIQPRQSVEPSNAYLHAFRTHHNDATWEERFMKEIILPIISGKTDITDESRFAFRNSRPVTSDETMTIAPHHYDGVEREHVHPAVLEVLDELIITSDSLAAPVAPNFFLTVDAEAAEPPRREATHQGAYGVQAMLALQNFGMEEPEYDNCAYTFSVTYRRGQLIIYCHHPSEPVTPDGRPIYTTTMIGGWNLLDAMEPFQEGVRAFRNVRDLAQRYRKQLVSEANARAEDVVA